MITVFRKSQELIDAWLRQDQHYGRTRTGNIFFEGPVIYSYGTHYPIAKLFPGRFATINYVKYSVTTSSHVNAVFWSIRDCRRIYVCDPLCDGHKTNLEDLVTRIQDRAGKAIRARVNTKWHLQEMDELGKDLLEYCRYFSLPVPRALDRALRRKLVVKQVTQRLEAA